MFKSHGLMGLQEGFLLQLKTISLITVE